MKKYRKKPVVVEAYQTDKELIIHTLEGDMKANVGDYIITGVNGEQYPCKPDIFEKTYEEVEEKVEENIDICDIVYNEFLKISCMMRDATKEEQEKVNKYIESISADTGINFWDLLEKVESKRNEVE